MSKIKIVKVNDDGTEEILEDDIKNIIYVVESVEEENSLHFGFTTNELKTEKVALMKFIFERKTAKILDDNYTTASDLDEPAAALKKLFDMI